MLFFCILQTEAACRIPADAGGRARPRSVQKRTETYSLRDRERIGIERVNHSVSTGGRPCWLLKNTGGTPVLCDQFLAAGGVDVEGSEVSAADEGADAFDFGGGAVGQADDAAGFGAVAAAFADAAE